MCGAHTQYAKPSPDREPPDRTENRMMVALLKRMAMAAAGDKIQFSHTHPHRVLRCTANGGWGSHFCQLERF